MQGIEIPLTDLRELLGINDFGEKRVYGVTSEVIGDDTHFRRRVLLLRKHFVESARHDWQTETRIPLFSAIMD